MIGPYPKLLFINVQLSRTTTQYQTCKIPPNQPIFFHWQIWILVCWTRQTHHTCITSSTELWKAWNIKTYLHYFYYTQNSKTGTVGRFLFLSLGLWILTLNAGVTNMYEVRKGNKLISREWPQGQTKIFALEIAGVQTYYICNIV